MKNYVITIARGFGSGGKYIGSLLSQELNIPCYDSQLPSMLEEYSGINRSKFASVDETLNAPYFLKILSKATTKYIASPAEKDFVSDNNLFNIQAELIESISSDHSCIIIGKCANHILQKKNNVVSVYIEAPRATCVKNVVDMLGYTEEEAHKIIQKTDKYRSDYYKYYTGGASWTDPIAYHMTLNTGKMTREHCVKTIIHYLTLKELIRSPLL